MPRMAQRPCGAYIKQKNIKKLLGVAVFIIVIAAAVAWYFNLDSVKSCGVSDSEIDSFSADATIGEIFDAYFKDSKWDHYDQNGQTVMTYGENAYSADDNEQDTTSANYEKVFLASDKKKAPRGGAFS